MIQYPKREQFFAMRFLRLLTKAAAAMHIGADGCMLLMIVVGQEDACRYTRSVSFWNHQLETLLGLRGVDEHALRRIRDRCVRAGWLQYSAGNKQQPASYFVTIPAAVNQLPDGSCDESQQQSSGNTAPIPQQTRQESGENTAGKRQESGENTAPSIPSPIPNPNPRREAQQEDQDITSTKQAPKKEIKANGQDLYRLARGMVKSYGKEHGISALDACLEIHDHQTIVEAIKKEFSARGEQIPADDLAAVVSEHARAKELPPIGPCIVRPMIDLETLRREGRIVPARKETA